MVCSRHSEPRILCNGQGTSLFMINLLLTPAHFGFSACQSVEVSCSLISTAPFLSIDFFASPARSFHVWLNKEADLGCTLLQFATDSETRKET